MKDSRTSFASWLLWLAGLVLVVAVLPSAKFGIPVWKLPLRELVSAAAVGAALLLSALIVALAPLRGGPLPPLRIVTVTAAVFSIVFFALLLTGKAASLWVIMVTFAVALTLLAFSAGRGGLQRLAIPAVYAVAAVLLALAVRTAHRPPPQAAVAMQEFPLHSAYYNLVMESYTGRLPQPKVRGGGIARVGAEYLVGTGDGHFYLFNLPSESQSLNVRPLPYRVPANGEAFAQYLGQRYGEPHGVISTETMPGLIESWQFRVAGILVQELGDQMRLFASHHFWDTQQHCMVVRVSVLEGAREAFMAGAPGLNWRTLYQTHPCVPIAADANGRVNPFTGEEMGGRMALLDDRTLLVALGDLGFSGETTPDMFSQDPAVSYGKVQMIPLDGSPPQAYDSGHRNTQGLYVDPQGVVWSTEHGPQGGDELNRIVRGANYGWPRVTYGTDYGSLAWPLNPQQGRHEGFEKPVYAWIPSIGTSNLISIRQNVLPAWHGDLIVGSLKSQSLWRMRLEDGHVVVAERVETPKRIRDLIETDDGRIIVWSDDATLNFIRPAKGTEKELAFATLCSGCHAVQDGKTHGLGPDLRGIVGRDIASASGYPEYSGALRAKSGEWTAERLDAFLTAPQKFAPGTRMAFGGISDAATRAAVIDYLKSAH